MGISSFLGQSGQVGPNQSHAGMSPCLQLQVGQEPQAQSCQGSSKATGEFVVQVEGRPAFSVSVLASPAHSSRNPFSQLLLFSARSANSLLAALASLTFASSNPKAELRSHSSGPVINSLNSKRLGLAFKDLTTTVPIHLSPVFLIPLHPFYPLPAKLSHPWALDLAFTWCKCPLVAAVDTALLAQL